MGVVFGMRIIGGLRWWLTGSIRIETWISVIEKHKGEVDDAELFESVE